MKEQVVVRKQKSNSPEYQAWINKNEKKIESTYALDYMPKFSVVIPVYNVEDEILIECIESIRGQYYTNWELCLVDDASTWDNVRRTLEQYQGIENIHVVFRKENGHIAKTTNDGISITTGDYIVFSDCDDVLAPNALLEVAKILNKNSELDFIYSDEDKLTEDGKFRHSPFFKPDWSPDTFMSLMYTNHLGVYKSSIVKEIGGLRSEVNGSQDYDFTLRFMEKSNNCRVGHIPKVLYYWREREGSAASTPQAKPYAIEANRRLKEEALTRRGLSGKVEYMEDLYQFRIIYQNKDNPLVSIVIPSKDNFEILKQCLDSIFKCTNYSNYEIILVDNGSGFDTKGQIEKYIQGKAITYIYEPMQFNFSRMCNLGVEKSKGEYVLLLNDDIEICQNDWLDIMLGHASLPYVGAVGAKLYYPGSNLIQHVGVTNLKVGPSHSFVCMEDNESFYFGRNKLTYNYLAVTAACLLVSKKKYLEVNGLEEELAVAYNDMDFCFKLYEHGYYNVVRNDVQLFHHESVSRGLDHENEEKMRRLFTEKSKLYSRHPDLDGYDPFYNINLCKDKNDFSLNINAMDMDSNSWIAYRKRKEFVVGGHLCLDKIQIGEKILVEGWFTTYDAELDNEGIVTVMLTGNVGQVVEVAVNRTIRKDVAKVIETNSDNTGFRCIIDSYLLHDKNHLAIGVQKGRKKVLIKSEQIIDVTKTETHQLEKVEKSVFEKCVVGSVVCNIDNLEVAENELRIKGFAYDRDNLYNNLTAIRLCIIDSNENCYLSSVDRMIRYDVSRAYGQIPNLLWSGFEATIEKPVGLDVSTCKLYIVIQSILNKNVIRSTELSYD